MCLQLGRARAHLHGVTRGSACACVCVGVCGVRAVCIIRCAVQHTGNGQGINCRRTTNIPALFIYILHLSRLQKKITLKKADEHRKDEYNGGYRESETVQDRHQDI